MLERSCLELKRIMNSPNIVEDDCFNFVVYRMEKEQGVYFSINVDVADVLLLGKIAEISEEVDWSGSIYVKTCKVAFFYDEAIVFEPRDIILQLLFP
jgi:hypothetical protein